jgi:hypothetical protein
MSLRRGPPPPGRREADPERNRRDRVRAETRRGLEALDPRRAAAGAAPARRGKVPPAAVATLAAAGVDLGAGAPVGIGRLVAAHAGPSAPLKVQLALGGAAHPKPARVVAPSWLEVVRMLPCDRCSRGRPLYEQLQLGRAQSEANHHPRKGRAGGGSDLEAHPLCTDCHKVATANQIPDATLDAWVARTLLTVVRAIREGRLDSGILLAAWVEAVIAKGY